MANHDGYPNAKDVWLRDKEYGDAGQPRQNPISRITIHCVSSPVNKITDAWRYMKSKSYDASWTYCVAANGDVGYYLSESLRPGTSSNWKNDDRAITMEVSCECGHPYPITDASLAGIVDLCEYICKKYAIKGLYYTGHISSSNLTLHRWFSNKQCPGDDIVSKLPYIANTVNNRLMLLHNWTLSSYTDPISLSEYNYRGSFRQTLATQKITVWKTSPSFLVNVAAKAYLSVNNNNMTVDQFLNDLQSSRLYPSTAPRSNWDGAFVDWCIYRMCRVTNSTTSWRSTIHNITRRAYNTDRMFEAYSTGNHLRTSDPRIGDLSFRKLNGVLRVGIIYNLSGSNIYVLEGNLNGTVGKTGYARSVASGYVTLNFESDEKLVYQPSDTPNWSGGYYGDSSYNYRCTALPQEYLSADNLYPYIITLDRESPELDYNTLQEHKIAGAVVEAGMLFNSSGAKLEFKSPKFNNQVKALDESDIPYGLWMTCRARTETEAKQEMSALQLCVQTSNLNLGVWLDIQFKSTSTKAQNDAILNVYKKRLHGMGLAGKIGLYVTHSQLDQITWENHMEEWLLWLVERLTSQEELSTVNTLLVPDFWNIEHVVPLAEQTYDPSTSSIVFSRPYPFPVFEEAAP